MIVRYAPFLAIMLVSLCACSGASHPSKPPVSRIALHQEAESALRRVREELLAAARETVFSLPETPTYTEQVSFLVRNPGAATGEDALGQHRRIEVDGRDLVVVEGDAPHERRTVLTQRVAPRLAGERKNSIDDNGNGLIDESGFHCVLSGDEVVARPSLEARDADGSPLVETVEARFRIPNGRSAEAR